MKKIITLLLIGLLPILCFAQIKEKVCIVRPNYSDKLVNSIKEFEPRLKKLGIKDTNEYINNFLTRGSSGSGFIYVAPDGKNYIITNCHVIEDAATSSVVFQNENGEDVVYKNLSIIAASEEFDLALLAFPENEQPFTEGIPFYTKKLNDGDAVYTAGYPGLLGKPAWQFGSGTITNSNIKVEELINPSLSYVIQHSSQIDAGNSGGPLMIKDSDGIFKVIGINTWKITNRQDTNFSIPSNTVISFIEKALSGEIIDSKDPETRIHEQAVELQKILNKFNVTFEELTTFISIDFIADRGVEIFEYVYNHCTEQNRSVLKEVINNYSPILGIRYAIAWYIFNEYHKDEYAKDVAQKSSVKEDKLPEVPAPIKYDDSDIWYIGLYLTYTNGYAKTEWSYVNGSWKLCYLKKVYKNQLYTKTQRKEMKTNVSREIPEDKALKLGNLSVYTPNIVSISAGTKALLRNEFEWTHAFDTEVKINNIMALDITAMVNENIFSIYKIGDKIIYNSSIDGFTGVQFQLPIMKKTIVLMPYATIQAGIEYSNEDNNKLYFVERNELGGRINIFVNKKSNITLFMDANCNFEYNFNKKESDLSIMTSVGIAF